jgi:rod shape-determining protein MreD
MAYIVGIPLLVGLAILQSSMLGTFHFIDGRPDLILLAVIGWALAGGRTEAMVWGLIGGCLLDMFSEVPFGSSAIILILLAYLVSLYEGRVWEEHLLMPLGITLLASAAYHLWGLGILFVMGRPIDLPFAVSRVIMPSVFLNLILALPASQLLKGLRNRFYPPEVEI